ncbi:hypothetical protein [Pseudomonas viridiflava]|uniref:hypothetical protein n=1 Tax=Pseudomonas viridiflava TaxID=33069 RepID=UPI0013C2CE3D|nr:hypothetical protein [Pseudomonas viridiflava]
MFKTLPNYSEAQDDAILTRCECDSKYKSLSVVNFVAEMCSYALVILPLGLANADADLFLGDVFEVIAIWLERGLPAKNDGAE